MVSHYGVRDHYFTQLSPIPVKKIQASTQAHFMESQTSYLQNKFSKHLSVFANVHIWLS